MRLGSLSSTQAENVPTADPAMRPQENEPYGVSAIATLNKRNIDRVHNDQRINEGEKYRRKCGCEQK